LFVSTALIRYLKCQPGLGITIASRRLVAAQYADDTQVFLRGIDSLPPFLATMATFGDASGQRLNIAKTKALWLPPPAAVSGTSRGRAVAVQLPTSAHGIRLVTSATVLGIEVGLARPAQQQWDDRISKLQRILGKVVGLPLSIFGRAFCASSYATSTVLYHAEFNEQPSPSQVQRLEQMSSKVIEAGLHPLSHKHGMNPSKRPLNGLLEGFMPCSCPGVRGTEALGHLLGFSRLGPVT